MTGPAPVLCRADGLASIPFAVPVLQLTPWLSKYIMTPWLSIFGDAWPSNRRSGHGSGPGWTTSERHENRGRHRATAPALSRRSSARSRFRSPATLAVRRSGNRPSLLDERRLDDPRRFG